MSLHTPPATGAVRQLQPSGILNQRDVLACLYASLMRERYGLTLSSSPCEMHWDFADSVLSRNVYALRHLTDALRNSCARQAFMSATGVALPLGKSATWSVLLEWAGVAPEDDALREAKERVDCELRDLALRVNNPGQAREWVERKVGDGYTTLKKIKRSWWLLRDEGKGFELSGRGGNLHRLRPLIAAVISLVQAKNRCGGR